MANVLEVVRYTVNPEVEAQFLAAWPAAVNALRVHCPGFISSVKARGEGQLWIDVLEWSSADAARAASEQVMGLPEVAAWMGLIDQTLTFEHVEAVHRT